jgi:hypothetical protein
LLISSSSFRTKKVEKFAVKVTLEVLFIEVSKTWIKDFHEFGAGKSLRLIGYDTLAGENWSSMTEGIGVDTVKSDALEIVRRSQSILERVSQTLDRLELWDGQDLTSAQCESLIQAGVVVELILLPMASIRDVAQWRIERDII